MRLTGKNAALFAAVSRIAAEAYKDDRLLSCPVLSKAPHYGNILERFVEDAPFARPSLPRRLCLFARYAVANLGHFFFLLVVRLWCAIHRWKKPSALFSKGQPRVILDVFALLPRIAAEGTFRDLYLPGLASHAREAGFSPLYLYRLYGSRDLRVVFPALKALRASGAGLPDVCLLRWTDWFRLFAHIFLYLVSLHFFVRRLEKRGFAEQYPESYVLQALYDTIGSNVVAGEAARLAGLRLGPLLTERDRVISWYENQTVNKAFYRGVRQGLGQEPGQSPESRREDGGRQGKAPLFIGAQLLVWPEALLNNHPDDNEITLGLVPDKVVVNGPWFLPEKTTQNYAVGPALRYGHVFVPLAHMAGSRIGGSDASAHSESLLVLLSYHPKETRRVLKLVLPLARAGGDIVYRFHPATNPDDYVALLPEQPVMAKGGLDEALAEAGAAIGSGSGALAEAVARGVPVLAAEAESGVTLNYLPETGQGVLWEKVRRPEDVAKGLEGLLQARSMPEYADRVAVFRDMLFAEPTASLVHEAFELTME